MLNERVAFVPLCQCPKWSYGRKTLARRPTHDDIDFSDYLAQLLNRELANIPVQTGRVRVVGTEGRHPIR